MANPEYETLKNMGRAVLDDVKDKGIQIDWICLAGVIFKFAREAIKCIKVER